MKIKRIGSLPKSSARRRGFLRPILCFFFRRITFGWRTVWRGQARRPQDGPERSDRQRHGFTKKALDSEASTTAYIACGGFGVAPRYCQGNDRARIQTAARLTSFPCRYAASRAAWEFHFRDRGSLVFGMTLNPKTGPAGRAKYRQNISAPSVAFANAKTSYRRTDRSSRSPS
jgi:hypothetical protein